MLQTLKNMKPEHNESDLAFKMKEEVSFFQLHQELKMNQGSLLAKLHDEKVFERFQKQPEKALQDISKEQNFHFTFMDIPEKTKDGKFHCCTQLTTNPVTVCFGEGESPAKAKYNSACNALTYLRIMTK